ncbi:hypothetical protein V8C42DRAFT_47986 [Trichoderma barbatum]
MKNFSLANAYVYNAMQRSWAETYQSLGARIKSVYIWEFYLVNELSKGWTRTVYTNPQVQPTHQVFAFAKKPPGPSEVFAAIKVGPFVYMPHDGRQQKKPRLALKSLRSPLVCVQGADGRTVIAADVKKPNYAIFTMPPVRSKAMSPQITKCQSPQRSSALYCQRASPKAH